MAKDRQKLAYIRNKQHLSYANMDHYKKAINCKDIIQEEYHIQSVLNSSTHAKHLKNEVFQKKKRNHVTNMINLDSIVYDKNSHIDNKIKIHDQLTNVKYSKVVYKEKTLNEFLIEPDKRFSFICTIEDIIKFCDNSQLKVLAYYIVSQNLDNIIVEEFSKNSKLDELRIYILQIWDLNVSSLGLLNDFIGSKSKGESARKKLIKIIKEKFPTLLES